MLNIAEKWNQLFRRATGTENESSQDILAQHRNRIFLGVAVAVILLLLPFSINHFLQSRISLGITTMSVVLLFLVEAVPLYLGREPPFPPVIAFIPLVAALGFAIVNQGYVGILWVYPTVMLLYFMLPRALANVLNTILVIGTAVLTHVYIGVETTPRVLATFALCMIVVNIFLGIVSSLQHQLHQQARVDMLTGAFNRRHLEECFREMRQTHLRYATPLSMLLLDIDHFKAFNDRLGHAAGDQVLRRIAARTSELIRVTDRLFRIGGEEFVVLLPHTGNNEALNVAGKLCLAASTDRSIDEQAVTLSIGVGELGPEEDWDEFFKRCDAALYRAKESGRNRVMLADGVYRGLTG